MKKIKYILTAFVCTVLAGCMGGEDYGFDTDWNAPDTKNAYGNNSIEEDANKLISIKELKSLYAATLKNQHDTARIKEDVQIKVRVTGNDIEGNIYNQISVKDETGAILICIGQGGLYSYLPVGQEILVNLKDLYIGCYGFQPQIGMPYTSKSKSGNIRTTPNRIARSLWHQHFKLLGTADASKVEPEVFDLSKVSDKNYIEENNGKLMTVKNVRIGNADGVNVFCPDTDEVREYGNGKSWAIQGYSENQFVMRTSLYADFAGVVMPQGNVNITGIFTRYGTTWQVLLREYSDIQEVTE
ncbi:DUF5689 domain-containing protein [Xylanibacter muris]|uniref:DUF5689 domain-containing protein n=1 Tax=Xylanibacter muris TaxID=2736290 RepID=A0ABX2AMW1_9BACT|nr:DUF5689 domain-containing protein [Xylanibacter muris]NPD91372.1 hypothetical protein [Xylanibacter muris]